MHQTVAGCKHFLRAQRIFVWMMFESKAARYEETNA
jgi:hypothetical protein